MRVRVGLTGGIGSGKSTVSALLAEHGAVVIDYDLLAREVVEPGTPARGAIVERFGDQMLTSDGTLDRPQLGSVVFADEAARRDLEAITHTAIRERAAALESATPDDAVVVHDHPLLVEMGMAEQCDLVVVVDVPESVQLQRLVDLRGMTDDDARARIASQADRDTRTGAADRVIDNTGPVEALESEVSALWAELAAAQAASSGSAT